ncbi:MAG: YvcK family protein [Chloroflexi bacterium]|nr:YvcK family protein [Chloroflexota bacterium]BCY19249.1 putative gluconeogenesis factor [Leptolinea sp. HRD-7]
MQKTSSNWYSRIAQQFFRKLRWLVPGLGVKRWLLVILTGAMLIGLGFAVMVLDVYRTAPDTWWLPVLSYLSLRFLDRPIRAVIFGGLGILFILFGTYKLNRALLRPYLTPGKPVLDTVSAYRKKERGPRIVVIGGGTGLSALLRGLKNHTNNLTAVVTVADDGGSSGELRRNMGVLPPGDIRNCLTALSNDEAMLTQIFQYRFGEGAGLNGHTLGNLFITALADITGSFEEAVAESGRVLAVQGRVLPSTLHDVKLVADKTINENQSEIRVTGESNIPTIEGRIKRVWLEPDNPLAYPPAVQAILSAELIIVGPGSLFTSILPNLLVPDLAEAVKASRGTKFYICNVATQTGETDGFTTADHIRTIEKHLNQRIFDLVICNQKQDIVLPEGIDWVRIDDTLDGQYTTYASDLIDPNNPWRHDSGRLAQVIMDLFYERTGPLISKETLQ